MTEIAKVAAFAAATALCAAAIRKQSGEIALVLALTGSVGILAFSLRLIGNLRNVMETLAQAAQLSPVVTAPVMKTVGVSVLTHFGAQVCKDARENGLAAAVEFAGTAVSLCLAAPLLQLVLDKMMELL